MVEVMLPVTLLVAAGAFGRAFFGHARRARAHAFEPARDVPSSTHPFLRVAAPRRSPQTSHGAAARGWARLTSARSCSALQAPLCRAYDQARAGIMLGGMFGNTFNSGVPVLISFTARGDALRGVNDMLMTIRSCGASACGSRRDWDRTLRSGLPSVWRVMFSMPPIWALCSVLVPRSSALLQTARECDVFHRAGDDPVTLFVSG